MSAMGASGRITSMDQFRGYTVAGMFVVNFLGGLAAIHPVMKHNNTYFSYADSIMPSFLFACGFSYRLTTLRRLPKMGAGRTYRRTFVRSLGLVLVSLMLSGFGGKFSSWQAINPEGVREFLARLIKADLWEVLAIIGVSQILIMPVIAAGRASGSRRWGPSWRCTSCSRMRSTSTSCTAGRTGWTPTGGRRRTPRLGRGLLRPALLVEHDAGGDPGL